MLCYICLVKATVLDTYHTIIGHKKNERKYRADNRDQVLTFSHTILSILVT